MSKGNLSNSSPKRRKFVSFDQKKHPLLRWFSMSEEEVLAHFAKYKDAIVYGKGDEQCVYIPPTRKNSVLLVAHADTVWDKPIRAAYSEGRYFSFDNHTGIGADDRAGCFIVNQLVPTGHAILITNGEESGCVGARAAMRDDNLKKTINSHQFALEFDRMNDRDMAFYQVGTDEFKDWCEKVFPKYKRVQGSHTDICVLCEDICGMNISVGYYGQHSSSETLIESELMHTLNLTKLVLSNKDIPKFKLEKPKYTNTGYHNTSGYTGYPEHHRDLLDDYPDMAHRNLPTHYNNNDKSKSVTAVVKPNSTAEQLFNSRFDDLLICPDSECDMIMMECEYRHNGNKCTKCNKPF